MGTRLAYCWLESPVGRLLLAGDDASLHYVSFPRGSRTFLPRDEWVLSEAPFDRAKAQLAAYFSGERQEFDLELTFHGTAFQRRVWRELQAIPYGETWSYGELARRLGLPNASRAVGAANGANPIPIIVPCHRVIGSTGKLTGFGGGIETKRFLLAHEAANAQGQGAQLRLL
ncbi:methylated-DNA--[protein]-cysteine S-methyltransferase [Pelagibacterium xiamenense]|uniref:methylated-DNA--[protein]-cysteine S-methyltransferase n=1 Tax=Pelagibacterium xiamenense TaxID=2901140 RepID=UPI0021065D8E|nr:methylated-DNA--[protein]-cysteine S-methyltransferase [Pelagibacterium xiamenense]